MRSEKIATTTRITMTAALAAPSGLVLTSLRRKSATPVRRPPISVADPRVQQGVDHVDEQVVQQDHRPEQQIHARYHRIVTILQGEQHQPAEPGQVEDILHDNRATDQNRQLQTDQRNDGDQRVLEGVPHYQASFGVAPSGRAPSCPQDSRTLAILGAVRLSWTRGGPRQMRGGLRRTAHERTAMAHCEYVGPLMLLSCGTMFNNV